MTAAQRYNARMDAIFEDARKRGAFKAPELPGCSPDVKGLLTLKARAPMRPGKPQQACDIGLFSDDADQLNLVSFFTEQSEQ